MVAVGVVVTAAAVACDYKHTHSHILAKLS